MQDNERDYVAQCLIVDSFLVIGLPPSLLAIGHVEALTHTIDFTNCMERDTLDLYPIDRGASHRTIFSYLKVSAKKESRPSIKTIS